MKMQLVTAPSTVWVPQRHVSICCSGLSLPGCPTSGTFLRMAGKVGKFGQSRVKMGLLYCAIITEVRTPLSSSLHPAVYRSCTPDSMLSSPVTGLTILPPVCLKGLHASWRSWKHSVSQVLGPSLEFLFTETILLDVPGLRITMFPVC